jgi:hypothetical protein
VGRARRFLGTPIESVKTKPRFPALELCSRKIGVNALAGLYVSRPLPLQLLPSP